PLHTPVLEKMLEGMELLAGVHDGDVRRALAEWAYQGDPGSDGPATVAAQRLTLLAARRELRLRGMPEDPPQGAVRALDGTYQVVSWHAVRAMMQVRAFGVQNAETGTLV